MPIPIGLADEFRSILEDRYPELDQRGFDFSKDYEVINELGQTLIERANLERDSEEARKQYAAGLKEASALAKEGQYANAQEKLDALLAHVETGSPCPEPSPL